MKEILPIIKGLIKFLPGITKLLKKNPGGGTAGNYYYSVYLRHYVMAQKYGQLNNPLSVLELGPGSTLGIGITALLTGTAKYYALDAVKHWNSSGNKKILAEISSMVANCNDIPDNIEFPNIKPELSDYKFPIVNIQSRTLQERAAQIESSLVKLEKLETSDLINFISPLNAVFKVPEKSIDFILSQAVLEHIEGLDEAYFNMSKWIKPGGLISHVVDFKSHGITKTWNGHWQYNKHEWKIIKANKPYLINRHFLSEHLNLIEKYGFEILHISKYYNDSSIQHSDLAQSFKKMTDEDLITSGIYFLAKKN